MREENEKILRAGFQDEPATFTQMRRFYARLKFYPPWWCSSTSEEEEIIELREITPKMFEQMNKIIDMNLTKKEAYVVRRRFGLSNGIPCSFDVCGRELNVSRDWVMMLEKKALIELKKFFRIELLEKWYLGLMDDADVVPADTRKILLAEQPEKLLGMPIEEFGFTAKIHNCLKRIGCNTVGDVANKTEKDLTNTTPRYFTPRDINFIKRVLREYGLSLSDH